MKRIIIFIFLMIIFLNGCVDQKMLDRNKVLKTVNSLFVFTDQRDWEKVKSTFADEVLFDMTSLAGGKPVKLKPQDIVNAWDKGLKPLKAIHHQVGNYMVTIKGEQATVFCYGIAYHYLPNPTKRNTRIFVGSYDFHLIKKKDVWKIDQFKFNLKFLDGNLSLEKSAK